MQNIILIVVVVAFAAFMFYNSRKRKRQQEELSQKMVPGSRVMLSFGVYGTLLSINEEKVTADVEVAPGTVITVHRQTLSRVVEDDATLGTDLSDASAAEPAAAAEKTDTPVAELNGEPLYGERTEKKHHAED